MLPEKNKEVILDEFFESLRIAYLNSRDNLTFDFSNYYLYLLFDFRYTFNEDAYNSLQSFFVGFLSSGKLTCDYYHKLMAALNNEYHYLYCCRQDELESLKEKFLSSMPEDCLYEM